MRAGASSRAASCDVLDGSRSVRCAALLDATNRLSRLAQGSRPPTSPTTHRLLSSLGDVIIPLNDPASPFGRDLAALRERRQRLCPPPPVIKPRPHSREAIYNNMVLGLQTRCARREEAQGHRQRRDVQQACCCASGEDRGPQGETDTLNPPVTLGPAMVGPLARPSVVKEGERWN